MSQPINLVAQRAMDNYYGDYRSDSDFFTLEDFVDRAIDVIGDYYRQEYKTQYDQIRAEKRDDVVGFTPDVLLEQFLQVKSDNNELWSDIEHPFMSFVYDQQSIGIQNIFPSKPYSMEELERSSVSTSWQLKHLPNTNRIFFRVEGKKIKYFNKGNCALNEVRVLYVPSAGPDMEVPDGITAYVIQNVVTLMKQAADKQVIKKSLDQNQNATLETEIDKAQLK